MKEINRSLSEIYPDLKPRLQSAGENIVSALKHFLDESNISYLSIYSRTKSFESCQEKILRKKYNSIEQIEDLCGCRIVLYYVSDIERVREIVRKEFSVIESIDKKSTNATEFGYRSVHFLIKFRQEWGAAPNFRQLLDIKIELQVRTVLMHAWAEIEHKLQYKKAPNADISRRLSMISAMLESADSQFEEIKNLRQKYIQEMLQDFSKGMETKKEDEMNADSLLAFLKLNYNNMRESSPRVLALVSKLFNSAGVTFQDLHNVAIMVRPKVNEEVIKMFGEGLNQAGYVKVLMDIYSKKFFFHQESSMPKEQLDFYNNLRKQYNIFLI